MLRPTRRPQVTKAFETFWACSFWASDARLGLVSRVEENADGSWNWMIGTSAGKRRSFIVAQGNKPTDKAAKRAARVAALRWEKDGKP